jgi:hypothetical protein
MGYFRHHPEGAHDMAHLSTEELKEFVEYYRERMRESPKFKLYKQMFRKYDYELKRRSDKSN